jgi:N-methylhydantoinase A
MTSSWLVGVDIGGTFTDVVAARSDGAVVHHLKVPSMRGDPAGAVLAAMEALDREASVQSENINVVLHGTTIVTNAIIERRLVRTALVTTAGFRDVLEIGRHWRQELYDPFVDQPPPLVPRDLRFEVHERLAADGTVLTAVDPAEVAALGGILASTGVEAVAVILLHSYRNPTHELQIADMLRQRNGWFVCASAELSREVREYERTSTTVLNAALMPLIKDYLQKLDKGLADAGSDATLYICQSNGGALTPSAAQARPVSLALSGPVGGVMACVQLGLRLNRGELIGLDMGGTSADVSIITDFEPRFANEIMVGELPIRLPSVQVLSIGAGGGSIASVDAGGAASVGPASAGSEPGPACYGKGGIRPTVTDSQLVLGRLSESQRLADRVTLDLAKAASAIQVEVASRLGIGLHEAASGIIEIANAAMERAVRVALRKEGDDPRTYALVAFGGAGPLHACELAYRLGIETVIVPPHPGTFSALGLLASDVRLDFARSELHRSDEPDVATRIAGAFAELEAAAAGELEQDESLAVHKFEFRRTCDVRYTGQAYEVRVSVPAGRLDTGSVEALFTSFHDAHQRAYHFSNPEEICEVVTFRTSAVMALEKPSGDPVVAGAPAVRPVSRSVYMQGSGFADTPTYQREQLPVGHRIAGPAVIHQSDSTTLLPPYARAEVDPFGNLIVSIKASPVG